MVSRASFRENRKLMTGMAYKTSNVWYRIFVFSLFAHFAIVLVTFLSYTDDLSTKLVGSVIELFLVPFITGSESLRK